MSDTKSKIKSYLFSYGLATAVLMVGLYPEWFAEYGLVETLIKVVVWLVFIIGFFAVGVLGIGAGALLWFQDEFNFDDDIEKVNTFLDQYNEIQPKMWYSIPLTLYWLTVFVLANKATGDWGVTGVTYLLFTVLTWTVIFGFAKAMNHLADRLRKEHEESDGKPAELRNLSKK